MKRWVAGGGVTTGTQFPYKVQFANATLAHGLGELV
jgi:hypothetical protein